MITRFKRGAALCALLVAMTSDGLAQIVHPPRHDTQSEAGVSYRTLSFNLQAEDLSIGGGGYEGLSLLRSYASNYAGQPGMFVPAEGWRDNFTSSISRQPVPIQPGAEPPPEHLRRWMFEISVGHDAYAFIGGARYPHQGQAWGSYQSISANGAKLVFNGTDNSGYYTLTKADGSIINFTTGSANIKIKDWSFPDGTRLEFNYVLSVLESVFSNRGFALLFDGPSTACAVNLAQSYVTPTSSCPAGVQTVTYGYENTSFNPYLKVLSTVTKESGTTTYSYSARNHLICIKDPGQSICRIANTYGVCPPDPYSPEPSAWRYEDPVIFQQTATGQTYSYNTDRSACKPASSTEIYDFPWVYNTATVTSNDGSVNEVTVNTGGLPTAIMDALSHQRDIGYETNVHLDTESVDVAGVRNPEGDAVDYFRDERGNILQAIKKAKPGSGLADMVTTAEFDTTCANPRTCNKPLWTKDARSNQTDYTYDPAHGGILTETGPAVNGVRPQKRYEYAQRYAWLKNASGGYSPAATPIWVKTKEEFCRTTSASGGNCAGGAADEVVTEFDYGPNSGPNNLLLRGIAVTADGQTLRTCYAYDTNGNKISETTPRAGLSSCN